LINGALMTRMTLTDRPTNQPTDLLKQCCASMWIRGVSRNHLWQTNQL